MGIIASNESADNSVAAIDPIEIRLVAAMLDADMAAIAADIYQETEEIDQANDIVYDMTLMSNNVKSAVDDHGHLTNDAVQAYSIAVESALYRLGVRHHEIKRRSAALESAISTKRSAVEIIAAIEEGDSGEEGNIIQRIWAGIRKMFTAMWEKLKGLFGKTEKAIQNAEAQVKNLDDDIQKLEKDVEASKGRESAEKTIGNKLSQSFEIDGKADFSTLEKLFKNAEAYCDFMTDFSKSVNERMDVIERAVGSSSVDMKDFPEVTKKAAIAMKQQIAASLASKGFKAGDSTEDGVFSRKYGPFVNRKYLTVSSKTENEASDTKYSFKAVDAKAPDTFNTFTVDEMKKAVSVIKSLLGRFKTSIGNSMKSDDFEKKVGTIASSVEKMVVSKTGGEENKSAVELGKAASQAVSSAIPNYGTVVGTGTMVINETLSTGFKVVNACLAVYKGKSSEKSDAA